MVNKAFSMGAVEIEIASNVRIVSTPQPNQTVPGGLFPLRTAAYELDEYRMMAGWPVPIPAYDIHAIGSVSANGSTFTVRDDNTAVQTGALIRWIADPAFWSETTLQWMPIQDGTGLRPVWETSVAYAPVLIDDYEYRVDNERFTNYALNFDSDTHNHLWADFTSSIGGGTGYTVIMVLSPNSSFGNNIDVPYNGLWYPGRATPTGNTFTETIGDTWMGVSIQGGYLYLATESKNRTRAISIQPALNDNAPLYLAMVFGRPTTTFYVGPGPSAMRVKSIETGIDAALMDNGVVLGRSTGDILHTADMALFDLGIYADQLTATQVHNEFALLSACYGGDS